MGARALAVVAIAAALVAAGGASAGKTTSGCSLLTRTEITAAIGERLASVQGGTSPGGAVYCNWTGNDTHVFRRGITLVAAHDHVVARYNAYKRLFTTQRPVSGVGVAAITDGNVILARSRSAMVQVGPMFKRSGISAAKVRALTKKALARA